jgi:hypothetical protein
LRSLSRPFLRRWIRLKGSKASAETSRSTSSRRRHSMPKTIKS